MFRLHGALQWTWSYFYSDTGILINQYPRAYTNFAKVNNKFTNSHLLKCLKTGCELRSTRQHI